jgi:hypothetical protein
VVARLEKLVSWTQEQIAELQVCTRHRPLMSAGAARWVIVG